MSNCNESSVKLGPVDGFLLAFPMGRVVRRREAMTKRFYLSGFALALAMGLGVSVVKKESGRQPAAEAKPVIVSGHFLNYEGKNVDLCDPRVFSSSHYAAQYQDLSRLSSVDLCNHWANNGIIEQRQAVSSFWPYEYGNFNGDLCPLDFATATAYYLVHGALEKRPVTILVEPVFNEAVYRDLNPDLAKLSSFELRKHFVVSGVYERRQSSRAFCADHYLKLNPDLQKPLNNDPVSAAVHFIRYGQNEGRTALADLEYLLDPSHEVGAIANSSLRVGFSKLFAGGIYSIKYKGREFINNYDHGRSLSYAWTYDGKGECDNPTENGSHRDYRGSTSSSLLKSFSGSGSSWSSINQPAFWLAPGDKEGYCPAGAVNANTEVVSRDLMEKKVSFGRFGANTIDMEALITTNRKSDLMQLELPTAYLNEDFKRFYTLDLQVANWPVKELAFKRDPSTGSPFVETYAPVIQATDDGNFAFAMVLEDSSAPGSFSLPWYVAYNFYHPMSRANSTMKSSTAMRARNLTAGSRINSHAHLFVGSLSEVSNAIRGALHQLNSERQSRIVNLAAGFSAARYLQSNPDIRGDFAVGDGPLLHCVIHGYLERRKGCYDVAGE